MQYKANETEFIIMDAGKNVVQVIPTHAVHQNRLYVTSTGVYFRSIEEYSNLLDDEHVRYNLYVYTIATGKITQAMFDIPFFELLFVYNDHVTGMKSELLFGLIGNVFEPLGAIKIDDNLLLNLIYNDASTIPKTLLKPKRFVYEYAINNETYTYLENWMFTSVDGKVTGRFPIDFQLNGFNLKQLQIKDSVYGFIGDYMNAKVFACLNKNQLTTIQTYPHFQYEIAQLVQVGEKCGIKQVINDDVEWRMNDWGEMEQVIDPNAPAVLFVDGKFIELTGEIDPATCIYEYSENVKFYSHHAVLFVGGKVKQIVMLPLHLTRGKEIRRVEGVKSANVEGEEMDLGFLDGFAG